MKKIGLSLLIFVFMLVSANISHANPWGIGMKIIGGLQALKAASLLNNNSHKNDDSKADSIMDWAKKETVKKRWDHGKILVFGERIGATMINKKVFTFFYHATLNSTPTVVALTLRGTEDNRIQYIALTLEDMNEYEREIKKYNNSPKHMVHGMLLSFGIDLGPIESDPQETSSLPNNANIQSVAYTPPQTPSQ